MSYKITGIYIYPIKSLPAIYVTESVVEETGLQYDRNWLLTDENNQFITLREYPELYRFALSISDGVLHVGMGQQEITLMIQSANGKGEEVRVWDDTCSAIEVSTTASQFFSDHLSKKVKLMRMPEKPDRIRRRGGEQFTVSYADGYPFLILGEQSMKLLNSKLQNPLEILRFRPNLIFSGGEPHDEDQWSDFSIGSAAFRAMKNCVRCVVTTMDPQTGAKGKEPLKTLAGYRADQGGVTFGQNLICIQEGRLKIGDQISLKI